MTSTYCCYSTCAPGNSIYLIRAQMCLFDVFDLKLPEGTGAQVPCNSEDGFESGFAGCLSKDMANDFEGYGK